MTAGGVTAGIDFGLAFVADMQGEELGRRIQLVMEYAPEPPFKNGTPVEAGPDRTQTARESRWWMDAPLLEAAKHAGVRIGVSEQHIVPSLTR